MSFGHFGFSLKPRKSDPYQRRLPLFACYFDLCNPCRPDGLNHTFNFALPTIGRFCTPDRTLGTFLRWFRIRLFPMDWRFWSKGSTRKSCYRLQQRVAYGLLRQFDSRYQTSKET